MFVSSDWLTANPRPCVGVLTLISRRGFDDNRTGTWQCFSSGARVHEKEGKKTFRGSTCESATRHGTNCHVVYDCLQYYERLPIHPPNNRQIGQLAVVVTCFRVGGLCSASCSLLICKSCVLDGPDAAAHQNFRSYDVSFLVMECPP